MIGSGSTYISIFPVILALLAAALFGMAAPASKQLLHTLNPFSLAGLLYLGASLGLFPVLIARGEFRRLPGMDRGNLKKLTGAVVLGGIAGPILLLFGLRNAAASSVSLWLNLELVATAVLGAIFFKDHLGKTGWAGVLTALVSSIVLTMHEGPSGILPAALTGLACLCWGFDNHFTALIDGISAVQSTFIKGLFAGTVNTIIGHFLPGPAPAGELILYSLLLGGLSYGMSIVLYIMSAQKLGATRSQVIFSSAPFFGVIFSVIFLAESISSAQGVSIFLFIAAIALLILEHHEHRHEHHETEHTHMHRHDDLHHDHRHEEDVSYHEHSHRHDVTTHSHPHWPDLHHRHVHKD